MSRQKTTTKKKEISDDLRQFQELIAELYNNPIAFVIVVLGASPDPWQRKALRALVEHPKKRFAIRAGHGVGKTAFEAWVVLWFLFTRLYPKIICTAPTRQQLSDILWPELSKWLSSSEIMKRLFEWQKTRIIQIQDPDRWWASARTASKPENFAGIHERDVLFICDEASGISDGIYEVIEGALTTDGAFLILCGNPTRTSGEFYDAFHSRSRLYWTIRVSCLESPRVTRDYIENLKEKYGEGSDIFRVRVEGNFPRSEPDVFIPLEYAEGAAQRDVIEYDERDPENPRPIHVGPLHLGVDPARFGGDEIIFYSRIGPHVFPPEVHKDQETTVTAGQVIRLGRELMSKYHRPQIVIKIDVGGLGAGVFDMVVEQSAKENGEWIVVPINFGGAPTEDKKNEFGNFASQMWANLRDMLRDEELHLPNDKVTLDQVSSRKYKVDTKGRIVIEDKPTYKKRHHESPDRADGLVMCLWDPGHGSQMEEQVQTIRHRPATAGLRKKKF